MIKIILKLLLGIALLVIALAIGPLLLLWALNELGVYLWPGKVLPYTWQTWAAAFIFSAPFSSGIFKKTKKELK